MATDFAQRAWAQLRKLAVAALVQCRIRSQTRKTGNDKCQRFSGDRSLITLACTVLKDGSLPFPGRYAPLLPRHRKRR
jgi:hypothetical protein